MKINVTENLKNKILYSNLKYTILGQDGLERDLVLLIKNKLK